jgi:hypothetical protein
MERHWRSPQHWDPPEPRPAYDFRQALRTHIILRDHVPVMSFRSITWRYCAGHLPPFIALRSLSRHAGFRVSLQAFQDMVYFGEVRVARLIAESTPQTLAGRPRVAALNVAAVELRVQTAAATSHAVES